MTYQEQLLTDKWYKKRAYIISRDSHTCYFCGYRGSRLHVHHKEYLPNLMAWEYPDELLLTVCSDCHRTIHMPDLMLKKVESTRVGNIINKHYGER